MSSSHFEFVITYEFSLEMTLFGLCILSLVCAGLLGRVVYRSRDIARGQAKLIRDARMRLIFESTPDYALTSFVLFMAICDMMRSIILAFQYLRNAFNFLTSCIPTSFSGVLCLTEEFILWSLYSIDILCYGVICFLLYRYLRKRYIVNSQPIRSQHIFAFMIMISMTGSLIQTILAIFFEDYHFQHEIIFIPSLIILYCTLIYISFVLLFIRCCHRYWIINARNKFPYFVIFITIFVIPITLKVK